VLVHKKLVEELSREGNGYLLEWWRSLKKIIIIKKYMK